MEKPFVPSDFTVPLSVETPDFILRKLTTAVNHLDYEAVMSSKDSLRRIFSAEDEWPSDEMTLEENYQDLLGHEEHFAQRRGFTYTVLSPNEDSCWGCVYIYRWQGTQYDAQVYYWVRDSVRPMGLEEKLGDFLHQWLAEVWPFQAPAFPGREIEWETWEALQQEAETQNKET